ncbi:sigma-54 dependent transcriptional regulator [uncultured Roseivirga sp.]|uniref:sigma-54-dependent transcriptional regulator n=1 Tax=uncultured Roseivirga sp. TaxID=543088 RepID=UPI0030DA29E1|tara:strand:- start:236233 stop:237606 length:1374 start_codon:yes stop_codon:yes gene_type:complete
MEKILIIDDDQDICLLLQKYLSKKGYEAFVVNSGKEAEDWLKTNQVDLVLCDFKLPDYSGLEILQKIKIIDSNIQVIIITGYSDVRVAVEALKRGAFEYVTKPLYPDEILLTIQSALNQKLEENHPRARIKKKQVRNEFVEGVSMAAQTLAKHIELIAPTDMSVIIMGETGIGKEFVATAIHEKSKRADQSFQAVDCGALPKDLAGSELFGHQKGAFTGAIADKKGCFELANGGTLFLDEVGNLTYENQVKLLRVLQERKVKPLGATKEVEVDVRLVVATNENLKGMVKEGKFREDIYHRLNEFRIEVPPLRERPDDIIVYAEHFLLMADRQLDKEVKGFTDETKEKLREYPWHGNLRELSNVVKRAVLLCQGDLIETIHLPQEIVTPDLSEVDSSLQVSFNGEMPTDLKSVAEAAEKRAIMEVLKRTKNNKSKTADLLKVDRKTLYNKLKAYGIGI